MFCFKIQTSPNAGACIWREYVVARGRTQRYPVRVRWLQDEDDSDWGELQKKHFLQFPFYPPKMIIRSKPPGITFR